MKSLKADAAYRKAIGGLYLVPSRFHKALLRYVKRGDPIDGFLLQVIECHAGLLRDQNPKHLRALEAWAKFLQGHAPANCWGSAIKRRAWQELRGLSGWE